MRVRSAVVPSVFPLIAGLASTALFATQPRGEPMRRTSFDPPPVERALAVPYGDSERDAIVFRTEDGDGFAQFVPIAGGGFALRLFPGAGPDVTSIYLADADADGRDDLVARRGDGTIVPWIADATGALAPEPVWVAPPHPGAHHVVPPSLSELNAQRRQDELHAALRARLAAETLPSTRFDESPGSPVAWSDDDGNVVFLDASGVRRSIDVGSRLAGFRTTRVASGRFGPGGERAVAAIGAGSRPRLALLRAVPGEDVDVVEVFSPFTTVNVQVASGGLVFSPDPVNIQAGDTVHWIWAGINHTVTSGAGCVPDNLFCSPTNTNCLTAPASSTGATYDHTFPSAGTFPYFCRPHCDFGMTGTVNVAAAAAPGAVPDGDAVPGVPLKLGKGPGGTLDLTWSSSCSGTATNYAVYEGTIPITGGLYTHTALNCSLGNTSAANIVPGAGDRYYLLVPETGANDGSYGLDFIGGVRHQIPPAAAPCHPQAVAPCP